MAFTVARADRAYEIFAGKRFIVAWEFAPAADGPADSLAAVLAAEVEVKPSAPGATGTAATWSIASGHVEIVSDQLVLTLEEADTAALDWTGPGELMLSTGEVLGDAGDLAMTAPLHVRAL